MNAMKEQKITMLQPGQLVPRRGNRATGGFTDESLKELAESIKEKGILEPLIVRPLPDEDADSSAEPRELFEIVAGERRCRAAESAGLTEIPCQVRDLSDEEADEIALVDNLHRADLHPMDEAQAYADIHEQVLRGPAEKDPLGVVAAKVGKSDRYVTQRMQLVQLVEAGRKLWRKEDWVTLGHALLLCRLPDHVQERVCKAITSSQSWIQGSSVDRFADWIMREVYMELSKAPWDLADAQLLPGAGACTVCPKRTGANATLFPEVGKKDTCLDAGCFAKKAAALLAKKRQELKGKPHLLISEDWGGSKGETLSRYNWEPAKKTEKDAVQGLVVDGPAAGKVLWVRKKTNENGRHVPSEAERARTKKAKAEEKVKRETRLEIYRAIVATAAEETTGHQSGMPVEVLRMIAGYAFDRQYERDTLAKMEGWKRSNGSRGEGRVIFAKMSEPELLLSMLKCVIVPAQYSSAEDLKAVATAYRVDFKAIEKRVRAELSAKAKKSPKLSNVSADGKVATAGKRAKKKAKPGTCRVCGCTEERACEGGCGWVDKSRTLCSSCADGTYPNTVAKSAGT